MKKDRNNKPEAAPETTEKAGKDRKLVKSSNLEEKLKSETNGKNRK